MKKEFPLSYSENIVVQELKDEVLVCDLKNNRVFCLNQTAGEIWKLCDGKKEIEEIARILSKKLKTNVSEEMVWLSLDELQAHSLLANTISTKHLFFAATRREVIKRVGLSSMVALPLISFISMPSSLTAQSTGCSGVGPQPQNCPCRSNGGCLSGCCLVDNTTPVCGAGPAGTLGCFCQLDAVCTGNDCCQTGFDCCAPGNPVCGLGC